MCGIAGMFGSSDGETVRAMLRKLAHRGPDDEHWIARPDFALGACRLSILDVAGGRQPVANERQTVWAAQNGELYNFPELRRELLERGHEIHTRCDTEILPHLFEEHGVEFAKRIDGMFAVAIWDEATKTGVLARDRVGKKPLYYHWRGGTLYFASEIKALLAIPGFERRINLQALHHYLSFKHVPHPLSIFEGISILPPAHLLIHRVGREPELRRYWRLDFAGNDELSALPEEELVDELVARLRRGVERRLASDVPVGFFLSGGIDSSLTTALAAELTPRPIKTFTLTYGDHSTTPGKEQDRHWARWVAKKYQTEHFEETIHFGNFPENLRRILTCFDEPFSGVVSTYFLAQAISRHVKVALTGDGADELFGSYLSHRLAFPLANHHEFQRTGAAELIRPFERQPELLARLADTDDWAWRSKLLVMSEDDKAALYSSEFAPQMRAFSSRELLRRDYAALTARDPLNRVLEAEFKTMFPDQVLTYADRLSMAHSLETRSPFLDTALVEMVAGLPGHFKIRKGETKYLLKKAALRFFPQEMVLRPKEGFQMPVTEWVLGELEDYVRATLSPERLAHHGFFNSSTVQQWIEELYRDRAQTHYSQVNQVMALIIFQEWYELYLR